MPAKYHIHTEPAAPRFPPVGKLGIVDWREDCSACHNCVKRACIYGFYRAEADTLRGDIGYLDYIYGCKGCLSCVQDCTKGILTRVANPEFARLGDDYFRPDMILTTWFQAETGRIPVSGAGYGGPFSGSGFDAMWTDMSEIVRPTRDGIHGREYISTSVDIGRKQDHLRFDDGQMVNTPPPLLELPLPLIFEAVPDGWAHPPVVEAVTRAAARLGLLVVLPSDRIPVHHSVERERIAPWVKTATGPGSGAFKSAALVMIDDGPDVLGARDALKEQNADRIVAIRVPASPDAAARAVELTRQGAEAIHLVFDAHGHERAESSPRHACEVLRDIHGRLVQDGTRDQVTLIASGGVTLAEHMTKAILCGADLVAIDIPLLIALECRLCRECERGLVCPVALPEIDVGYAVQRMVNLIGAWHLQIIEMLGAMGIREVRRLRGETGRCMFFEDLEREAFGQLFGRRKKEAVPA